MHSRNFVVTAAFIALLVACFAVQSAQGQTFTVLYAFAGSTGDGDYPGSRLLRDSAGNLYGTTYYGGVSNLGTVFKLDTNGTETVLHSFTGGPTDGANPWAGLTWGAAMDKVSVFA